VVDGLVLFSPIFLKTGVGHMRSHGGQQSVQSLPLADPALYK